jgi:hypothetical protein
MTAKGCTVFEYTDGLTWAGIGVFVVFVPIPLALPSGRIQERFFLRDDFVVGRSIDANNIPGGIGYMGGSNDCGFILGPTKGNKSSQNAELKLSSECGELERAS